MPPVFPVVGDLEEVRELNRLFIEFLRAQPGAGGLALERAACRAIAAANPELIDVVAAFPRALFELTLPADTAVPAPHDPEPGRHALQLTILHSAWNMSRHRPSAARLLLGLRDEEIRLLRLTTLSELARLARSASLLSCAFRESGWLWPRLFSEMRPEARRQLTLIALQPHVPEAARARLLFARSASA